VLTGSAYVDLTAVGRDRQRQRLAAVLGIAPKGCRVVVLVGQLAPEPEAIDVLRHHEPRLLIDITGDPRAVRLWLSGLRDGLPGDIEALW